MRNGFRLQLMFALAVLCGFLIASAPSALYAQADKLLAEARNKMVDEEIVAAGVKNERVVASLRATPRHEFVPTNERRLAYVDMALPIGDGQTISPPFVVAYMTEQLDPQPGDKVLEIGTGSGYQAAVLSPLVKEVYSIEIVENLGRRAAQTLRRLKYDNVQTRIGDGYKGWPEAAPFDKIIVTCSPERVPQPLVDQLREGGRMVIPLGERYQQSLYLYKKTQGQLNFEALLPTLFVPMTGQAESAREVQPDPSKPQVRNGGFEELLSSSTQPLGWHYARQIESVEAADAPEGHRYFSAKNGDPGREARALQAVPVDGRQVSQLDVSFWVKGQSIVPGPGANDFPALWLVFYDDLRRTVDQRVLGKWRGTFGWQQVSSRVRVPNTARACLVRIGLLGATGEVCLDDIQVQPIK